MMFNREISGNTAIMILDEMENMGCFEKAKIIYKGKILKPEDIKFVFEYREGKDEYSDSKKIRN